MEESTAIWEMNLGLQHKIDILHEHRDSLCGINLELVDYVYLSDTDSQRFKLTVQPGGDAVGSLITIIIQDLQSGSERLLKKFLVILKKNDYLAYNKMQCSFAHCSLREHSPFLIGNIDVEPFLQYLSNTFSSDERDKINATKNRGEKVSGVLDVITRKLQCDDMSLFETFVDLLAGFYPEAFKCLWTKDITFKQAGKCIFPAIDEIKKDIKGKGHVPDKTGDKEIDFEKNFIRLCLTEQTTIDEKMTWEHQTPGIYQTHISTDKMKRNIEPEDILGDIQDFNQGPNKYEEKWERFIPKTVIQGRAGIGKSTLLQYLCQRWADCSWANNFHLLFSIQLRLLMAVNYKISLYELLTTHSIYRTTNNPLPYQWLENWDRAILINVDGLDEVGDFSKQMREARAITSMNEKAPPAEIIINLLRGNLLPSSHIICATRTFDGLYNLRIIRDLEVMGLTQDNVLNFMKKNLDAEKAERSLQHFKNSPVLLSMCAITYYCSVICQLLSDNQWIPDSDNLTYTRLTALIIMSHLGREADSHRELP